MEYKNRLYLILHPNLALVGSQLEPKQFADHYTSGSSRYYSGKVLFAELDPGFRHPYFPIEEMYKEIVPHEDGRPKATKFISSYRVLEHVDLDALEKLHLATAEGDILTLTPEPLRPGIDKDRRIRIYAEMAPLRMLVLSDYSIKDFADYITHPDNPKGAPVIFFTQIDIDVKEFVEDFDRHPFKEAPIKTIHPSRLRDGYMELMNSTVKHTKGLCVDSSIDQSTYRYVKEGFTFASQKQMKCFYMPDLEEIERINFKFFKHM